MNVSQEIENVILHKIIHIPTIENFGLMIKEVQKYTTQ